MKKKADKKADIQAADAGEPIALMEPLYVTGILKKRQDLDDLALELAQRSAGFRRSLPESMVASLAQLVRSMNCYYSNLIEGHDTHPVDIERALSNDYSGDARKRDLQLEAKAHIAVQAWIDEGGLADGQAMTAEGLREIHRRFCELLPEEMLWVADAGVKKRARVIPGELRTREVMVGKHVAVSSGAVPRFLARFGDVYSRMGRMEKIVASAAAHHRFVWIHPFLDGNGRVARLMSHAVFLETLETGALWSVARGLARRVQDYKVHLSACDQPRFNDLDGRGNLSERALWNFTHFFLQVGLDQVNFMESLCQPNRLRERMTQWAQEEVRRGVLPAKSGMVLEALLYRGELARGDVEGVVGTGERQARRIVSALLERGVLVSSSPRAPLRLAFPAALAGRWMPGLFPDLVS
ncbi:MAG: Fic family protein [Bryobacteraceae bacterium]|nr:Fic family protein [Bryobacteraceae bacterium]